MENHLPQIIAGFIASGGSYWLRNKMVRRNVDQAYKNQDKGHWRLKKNLSETEIRYKRNMEQFSTRLDHAKSAEEMEEIMSEAKEFGQYHESEMQMHKQTSDYYGKALDGVNKEVRFIKYNIPVLLAIASLGFAGYEAIMGNTELAISSLAFAIPHLFEAVANQKTGLKAQ
jgi:hypothetical protein